MDCKQLRTRSVGKVHADVRAGKAKECCMCLRPIKGEYRLVRLDANDRVWKPDVTTPVDTYRFPIGPDCARSIGLEWSIAIPQAPQSESEDHFAQSQGG